MDTALHQVVGTIETAILNQNYALAAFLDIEGAFNNVESHAIQLALSKLGVHNAVNRWLLNMLRSREVTSTIGSNSSTRFVSRGTPQGGVISPLLWLLVINDVLLDLKDSGVKVVAYADDVVMLATGFCTNTISKKLELALSRLSDWANRCGLGVNPSKTELILFTRRKKVPQIKLPKLNGAELRLSSEAKYLGVIIDSALKWTKNVEARAKKAQAAFYMCRKAIGSTWGISPKMTYWL